MESKMKVKAKFYVKIKIYSENYIDQLINLSDTNDYYFNFEVLNFIKKINNNLSFRWLFEGEAI
jgi:hypothetical protein